jgi:hypothetical protein
MIEFAAPWVFANKTKTRQLHVVVHQKWAKSWELHWRIHMLWTEHIRSEDGWEIRFVRIPYQRRVLTLESRMKALTVGDHRDGRWSHLFNLQPVCQDGAAHGPPASTLLPSDETIRSCHPVATKSSCCSAAKPPYDETTSRAAWCQGYKLPRPQSRSLFSTAIFWANISYIIFNKWK